MNDYTEMLYGWEVLLNNLRAYEKENNVADNKRLSNFMQKSKTSNLSNILMPHFYNEEKTPYVISFSERKDYLPMWSMYGRKGSGVCLCFDKEQIKEGCEDTIVYPILSTLYINQEEKNEITSKVLSGILQGEYKNYLERDKNDDLEKIQTIGTILPIYSAYIKNNAYLYEKEMRLVAISMDIKKTVRFRASEKGSLIPFVEIPIPVNSLQEIIVGPCVQPENIENGLLLALHASGLDVPVSTSQIPYREI